MSLPTFLSTRCHRRFLPLSLKLIQVYQIDLHIIAATLTAFSKFTWLLALCANIFLRLLTYSFSSNLFHFLLRSNKIRIEFLWRIFNLITFIRCYYLNLITLIWLKITLSRHLNLLRSYLEWVDLITRNIRLILWNRILSTGPWWRDS